MSIDPISSNSSAYTNEIQSMPLDIIGHIMSFVGVAGLQACTKVSRGFSKLTIQETNINKRKELSTFIGNMLLRLNEDTSAEQKTSLNEIKSSLNANFPNFVALKGGILLIKNQVIDLLKTLDEEDLNALEGTPIPSFCENIFKVAKICRWIPIACAFENATEKGASLQLIVRVLTKAGEFDRAIEVANTLENAVRKEDSLQEIIELLAKAGEFDRAIEVANTLEGCIFEGYMLRKERSFQLIVRVLAKAGEFDRAIEVANTLEDTTRKEESLQQIRIISESW